MRTKPLVKEIGGPRRGRGRAMIAVAGLTVVLIGAVAIATSGVDARTRKIDTAATYEVVVPAGGGEQWVQWVIGEATFQAMATSSQDPNTGGVSFGTGHGVQNNGPDPIAVVWQYPSGEETTWVPAAQSAGGAGEVFNTGDPPGAGRDHEMFPVAILDEGGVSATGIYAMSFRYDAADQTGHFIFTLQMKG